MIGLLAKRDEDDWEIEHAITSDNSPPEAVRNAASASAAKAQKEVAAKSQDAKKAVEIKAKPVKTEKTKKRTETKSTKRSEKKKSGKKSSEKATEKSSEKATEKSSKGKQKREVIKRHVHHDKKKKKGSSGKKRTVEDIVKAEIDYLKAKEKEIKLSMEHNNRTIELLKSNFTSSPSSSSAASLAKPSTTSSVSSSDTLLSNPLVKPASTASANTPSSASVKPEAATSNATTITTAKRENSTSLANSTTASSTSLQSIQTTKAEEAKTKNLLLPQSIETTKAEEAKEKEFYNQPVQQKPHTNLRGDKLPAGIRLKTIADAVINAAEDSKSLTNMSESFGDMDGTKTDFMDGSKADLEEGNVFFAFLSFIFLSNSVRPQQFGSLGILLLHCRRIYLHYDKSWHNYGKKASFVLVRPYILKNCTYFQIIVGSQVLLKLWGGFVSTRKLT